MKVEKEVARVFNGFMSLSRDQQMKFSGMLKDYESGSKVALEDIRESVTASVTKMQTGPYKETCGCCGR